MIPLHPLRVVVALLGVSAVLAFANALLMEFDVSEPALSLSAGILSGVMVWGLAFYLGVVFRFIGKGIVPDPQREALVRAAMDELGHGEASVSVMDTDRFVLNTQSEGRRHRVFVSRFVIDGFSQNALRGAMAHECGHLRANHPKKLALLLGVIAGAKLSVGVPMVVAILALLAFMYAMRQWEFAADANGAAIAGAETVLTTLREYQALVHPKEEGVLMLLLSSYPNISSRIDALHFR